MKPVNNSIDSREVAIAGSIWEPLSGGGLFSQELGLVIVDWVDDRLINYHYEQAITTFTQEKQSFYQFARRIS